MTAPPTSVESLGSAAPALRVAFVTQWFPPEPVGLPLWMAESLRARGADVHVVTGIPNYPDGRVQNGFSAWRGGRSLQDGIRVTRSPLFPSHSSSAVGRITNYLSFAAASSVAGRRVLATADVALIYGSPVTAAIPAIATRTPYVIVAQDLWPDSVYATGYLEGDASGARRAVQLLSSQIYHRAAHVVAITPGMRDTLVSRGLPAEQVSVVHNWVDETVLRPADPDLGWRRSLGIADESLLVLYAGTMGPAQALDTVVETMRLLQHRPDVSLVLLGSGTEREALATRAASLGLDQVLVLDPVATERIPGLIAAADLNLVSLADRPLFDITLPSKVQSTLACGGTVLGSISGDAAALVRAAGAGYVVPPEHPAELAAAIESAASTPREALREMGRNGRRYYEHHLSEDANAERLMALLTEHARPRKGERQ